MHIKVSAPGKVILHGEHAVVYGKSAIAASLNIRSEIELTSTENGRVEIDLPAFDLKQTWDVKDLESLVDVNKVNLESKQPISEDVIQQLTSLCCVDTGTCSTDAKEQACLAFLYLYTAINHGQSCLPTFKVRVSSKLPVGAGLGSSASFSTCLVTSLLVQNGMVTPTDDCGTFIQKDLELINCWAYQGERIIHGTPSGIDNSVATFGGAIKFQGGNITHLKSIPELRILLTSTGVARSTKTLVSNVRKRREKFPAVLDPIMDAIEAITERCVQCYAAMATGNGPLQHYDTLEELIDLNHHLLQALGVSHPTLDTICNVTASYRLHSKLTGAGGGGCAFTLLTPGTSEDMIDRAMHELRQAGFECFITEIGSHGVCARILGR